jgi:SAM-dependent methyltransferase
MDPILEKLADEVDHHYPFMDTDEDLAAHYKTMGEGVIADLETRKSLFTLDYIKGNSEPRFHMMGQILKDTGVKTMFDAGCGHGWSSLFFANNLNLSVVGYDVDPGAVKWAKEIRDQTNTEADAHFFNEWDKASYFAEKSYGGKLDAAICSEVLEHVVDPNKFIDRVETFVKPGGLVLCTVPFGPWEYDGPNWHGLGRTHIREISQHCIYEMFAHKTNFRCGAVRTAWHPTLGDPLGFYIFSWQADGKPSRKRDIDRMMKIQRPVETVAINIIAGPGAEKTIRWTLDSVRSIADEIIVGDTGLSAAGKQACADYGCKVIEAPNPLVTGFSVPRNWVLDHTTSDWVLWIDSDERLIQPELLRQYLRKNQANGYAMRQVHASVD